ncbi:unnamed protein product [Protopolystoma xenopodis]|uniref:Uncharacterized protein n=1 Tax=Protopolystoma xenopodis TaxID=117903 RepID=A0A3S5B5G3_9PLAT|nr:unnamed protein product [Protopolystoma xenopodis]
MLIDAPTTITNSSSLRVLPLFLPNRSNSANPITRPLNSPPASSSTLTAGCEAAAFTLAMATAIAGIDTGVSAGAGSSIVVTTPVSQDVLFSPAQPSVGLLASSVASLSAASDSFGFDNRSPSYHTQSSDSLSYGEGSCGSQYPDATGAELGKFRVGTCCSSETLSDQTRETSKKILSTASSIITVMSSSGITPSVGIVNEMCTLSAELSFVKANIITMEVRTALSAATSPKGIAFTKHRTRDALRDTRGTSNSPSPLGNDPLFGTISSGIKNESLISPLDTTESGTDDISKKHEVSPAVRSPSCQYLNSSRRSIPVTYWQQNPSHSNQRQGQQHHWATLPGATAGSDFPFLTEMTNSSQLLISHGSVGPTGRGLKGHRRNISSDATMISMNWPTPSKHKDVLILLPDLEDHLKTCWDSPNNLQDDLCSLGKHQNMESRQAFQAVPFGNISSPAPTEQSKSLPLSQLETFGSALLASPASLARRYRDEEALDLRVLVQLETGATAKAACLLDQSGDEEKRNEGKVQDKMEARSKETSEGQKEGDICFHLRCFNGVAVLRCRGSDHFPGVSLRSLIHCTLASSLVAEVIF